MRHNLTSGCTPTKTISRNAGITRQHERVLAFGSICNAASATSQHTKGEAIDLCRFANSKFAAADMYEFIYKNLPFDQLIWEHGTDSEPQCVHVSLKKTGNRRQTLTVYKVGNVTKYKQITE
jgi:hypothetical protein